MEKLQLVKRKTPKNDRRKYLIIITDKGKGVVIKIRQQTNKIEAHIRKKLTSTEIKILFNVLEKLSVDNDLEIEADYR